MVIIQLLSIIDGVYTYLYYPDGEPYFGKLSIDYEKNEMNVIERAFDDEDGYWSSHVFMHAKPKEDYSRQTIAWY